MHSFAPPVYFAFQPFQLVTLCMLSLLDWVILFWKGNFFRVKIISVSYTHLKGLRQTIQHPVHRPAQLPEFLHSVFVQPGGGDAVLIDLLRLLRKQMCIRDRVRRAGPDHRWRIHAGQPGSRPRNARTGEGIGGLTNGKEYVLMSVTGDEGKK